jgi:hypothetical protein
MTSSSMITSPSESICNPNFNPLKHGYLDAGHGVVDVAGDDGLDKNPRAVGGSLNDNTLEFVITFVLPLGLDADAVADFNDHGIVARVEIVAIHDEKSMAKFDYGDNQKVNDLHTKLPNF